jgi:hypothetical protein
MPVIIITRFLCKRFFVNYSVSSFVKKIFNRRLRFEAFIVRFVKFHTWLFFAHWSFYVKWLFLQDSIFVKYLWNFSLDRENLMDKLELWRHVWTKRQSIIFDNSAYLLQIICNKLISYDGFNSFKITSFLIFIIWLYKLFYLKNFEMILL